MMNLVYMVQHITVLGACGSNGNVEVISTETFMKFLIAMGLRMNVNGQEPQEIVSTHAMKS